MIIFIDNQEYNKGKNLKIITFCKKKKNNHIKTLLNLKPNACLLFVQKKKNKQD